MKPVVSSLVALAIAITPAFALAAEKSPPKPATSKVVKHHKKVERAAKNKPSAIAQVKHVQKDVKKDDKKGGLEKVHHTEPHKGEPKIDHGVTVIPASMTSAMPKLKNASTMPVKAEALPKLPQPAKAAPASHAGPKNAAEKGARKPAEKKSDKSDKGADDGQPERDEEFAELVARIRGSHAERTERAAEPKREGGSKAKPAAAKSAPPCTKDPVQIARGSEVESLELTKCDGSLAPLAVEHLSVLVRPGNADRPTTPLAELAKKKGPDLARGIKRVDPGLVSRLQAIADHFGKKSAPLKLSVVSGYRPASVGSLHQSGRAMDIHVEGVKNEELVAFCKTLGDTGCGYYPNSSFVHVDVRDAGAGHVSWIDASGPGEPPRYVGTWPPPEPAKFLEAAMKDIKDAEDKGLENMTAMKVEHQAAAAAAPAEEPAPAEASETTESTQ